VKKTTIEDRRLQLKTKVLTAVLMKTFMKLIITSQIIFYSVIYIYIYSTRVLDQGINACSGNVKCYSPSCVLENQVWWNPEFDSQGESVGRAGYLTVDLIPQVQPQLLALWTEVLKAEVVLLLANAKNLAHLKPQTTL